MTTSGAEACRRIDVFFYGLFMDVELLRQKGLHPTAPRIGWVPDTKLFIGTRAGIAKEPGSRTYGVVMSLPADDLVALYQGESLRRYRPENVHVAFAQGGAQPAVCYNVAQSDAGPFDASYAAGLREVARRVGLPDDYVVTIGAA